MSGKTSTVTPMMAQYLEIKSQYQDALLFYRMGDFYELFFDDAVAAAEALDIALTKRGKHAGDDIPMCGVPVHAAEGYLLTLIRKGFRVAVGEQLESPEEAKKRGSKSVVKRDVVRLVTPGTLTEDTLLQARQNNYLAALTCVRDTYALAWTDISTGDLHVMPLELTRVSAELARLSPAEILVVEDGNETVLSILHDLSIEPTFLSRASFDSANAAFRLKQQFQVSSLEGFGTFSRSEVSALGAVVEYLDLTQKGRMPVLQAPRQERLRSAMQIDASTRRNLELTSSLQGGRSGSLISVVDRTVTASGARLLQRFLSSPSCELETIHARLDAVTWCVENATTRHELRGMLKQVPDLERATSRLGLDRGGPRDLSVVRAALIQADAIYQALVDEEVPIRVAKAREALQGHDALINRLDDALVAEPPLLVRDGGFIASGFDAALDQARTLRDEGRGLIAGLQAKYSDLTGITSLKIKHNNVLGYFIETTATHADKMMAEPLSETFVHRQTTANQVRFTTVELSELERGIMNSGSEALEIEKRLFTELQQDVLQQVDRLHRISSALAILDVATSIADLATDLNWCRPKVDDSRAFNIVGGRHPVVENALRRAGGSGFIANDCDLTAAEDAAAIVLLTGPNMAGKSTYLRQNALIAILAQMGSFVPAASAHIGLVEQVFSRVGASDDLARGRSTFMVEMVETAAILNQAQQNALVILDEIGRGTATYDGLSIAWATLEHLQACNKVRALFATHYHELTALAGKLEGVRNATMAVREWDGDVVFLHEVKQGAADRSYGVQVARLAGLPASVIERARTVLNTLEKGEREKTSPRTMIDDLPLFSNAMMHQASPQPTNSKIEEHLSSLSLDEMTPMEALQTLYDLKSKLQH